MKTIIKYADLSLEIDWNELQFVTHVNDKSIVLMTNGEHDENEFTASVISHPNKDCPFGSEDNWIKKFFKPFYGSILIVP